MHPEIVTDAPGSCPICGMALEPRTISAVELANPELTDMTRRLWVAAALTIPIVSEPSLKVGRKLRPRNGMIAVARITRPAATASTIPRWRSVHSSVGP